MTTDTRVTGGLTYAPCMYGHRTASLLNPNWVQYYKVCPAQPRIGAYKSITSERSGRFQPGRFRVNPVLIQTGIGAAQETYAVSNAYVGYYFRVTGDWACYTNYPTSSYYDFGAWRDDLANLSFSKAKAKLKDAELDLAVMLGELKETLELLRNPFKALTTEMYKLYKFGWSRVNKKISFLDAVTGGWLTYRYGIIPLLSDIDAIIIAYHKTFEQMQGMSRCKASTKDSSLVSAVNQHAMYQNFTCRTEYVKEVKWSSTSHLYLQRLLEADAMYKARLMGFHPSQLPAAAWELVTLSFVFDWFVSVGQWLRAIMPDTNVKHLGNCTSQKVTVSIRSEVTAISVSYGFHPDEVLIPGNYFWESSRLERKVGTTTPVLPTFNPNPLNLKRTLDSLALLWGRILKPLARR